MAGLAQPPSGLVDAVVSDDQQLPSADRLATLQATAVQLRDLLLELADLEGRTSDTKAKITDLQFRQLPDLMAAARVDHVGIPPVGNHPGWDATMKPYCKANIAADWDDGRREAAFRELENLGGGDLIRNTVTVTFGKDENQGAHELVNLLTEMGLGDRLQVKRAVPWSSLTAFVKSELKRGTDVPLEALGAAAGYIVECKERE